MRRLGIVSAIVAALAVLWLTAYPVLVYRVRITVNVDTPQGIKCGSSVSEIHSRRYPPWTELSSAPIAQAMSIRGEAVFVDMGLDERGKQRNLVALLCLGPRGEYVDFFRLPATAFQPLWQERIDAFGPHGSLEKQRGTTYPDAQVELTRLAPGTRAVLAGKLIPTLVSFDDVNNPLSVDLVSPDELGKVFGNGVRLRSVTMEIVSGGKWPMTLLDFRQDSITETIEMRLPLLVQLVKRDAQSHIEQLGDPFWVTSGHLRQGF
jgi:hypothetical protein